MSLEDACYQRCVKAPLSVRSPGHVHSVFCAVGINSPQWKRSRRYHWTHRMVGMKAKSRWKSPVWAVNAALGTSVCREAEVGRDLWDWYVLPHLPRTGDTVALLPIPCLLPSERPGVYCMKRPLLLQLYPAQYPAHSIGTWYTRLSKEINSASFRKATDKRFP